MKRIIVNFLFVFSFCVSESSTAEASSLVDMFNLLHQSFMGLDENDEEMQAQVTDKQQEQQKSNCKWRKDFKRIEPKQTTEARWVRTPEGLKLYVRTGDKEIRENFSFNTDDSEIVEEPEIDVVNGMDGEDFCKENCENLGLNKPYQVNNQIIRDNKIGIPPQCHEKDSRIPEQCRKNRFGKERDNALDAATVRPGIETERNLDDKGCFETRGDHRTLGHLENRGTEKFDKNFAKNEHHHVEKVKDMGEAIFVEMRRQTRILKHIEEMLERRENFFRNYHGNKQDKRKKISHRNNY